jgi:uncharacterized YccA/Bax inhibitor family protein
MATAPAAMRRMRSFAVSGGAEATMSGLVAKTAMSLGVLSVAAVIGYTRVSNGQLDSYAGPLAMAAVLIALVVGLIASFVPRTAPVLTLPYAVLEGFFVGVVSRLYGQNRVIPVGHGLHSVATGPIVTEALVLTLGVCAGLCLAYKAGLRLSARAQHVITLAMFGVFFYYLVDLGSYLILGAHLPGLWTAGIGSIVLSSVITLLAAARLLSSIQFAEQTISRGAAKGAEWYGAFAILVSIVWLYLEVLRLLAKIQNR